MVRTGKGTTRGRKSGQEHTVLLQSFPDGENMIVVAANSGRPSHPNWFFNLKSTPTAQVEIMDQTLRVRAEELSEEEAAAFWPRVVRPPTPGTVRPPLAPSRSCVSFLSGLMKERCHENLR